MRRSYLFLFALLLITACARSNVVSFPEVADPAAAGSRVQRIAVMDFGVESLLSTPSVALHQAAEPLTVALINRLSSSYTVVDRSRTAEILREQELQRSGLVDDQTASRIGQLLGAEALLSGKITGIAVTTKEGTKEVSETRGTGRYEEVEERRYMDVAGPKKKVQREIMETVKVTKKITTREASASATFQLIRIESGEVLAADNATKTLSREYMEGKKVPSEDEARNEVIGDLASHIANSVRPKTPILSRSLLKAERRNSEAEALNERGIRFAKAGLWSDAENEFRAAVKIDPDAGACRNNLAVCLERKGARAEALKEYQAARNLLPDEISIRRAIAHLQP